MQRLETLRARIHNTICRRIDGEHLDASLLQASPGSARCYGIARPR